MHRARFTPRAMVFILLMGSDSSILAQEAPSIGSEQVLQGKSFYIAEQ